MNTLFLLIGLAAHVLAVWILIKHRRNVRRHREHRARIGIIGRDRQLTEKLHERLCATQPEADWMRPHIMRAKVDAWQRRSTQGGTLIDTLFFLLLSAGLLLLLHVLSRYVLQSHSF